MKKTLFLLPVLLLVAAGCNSGVGSGYGMNNSQSAATQTQAGASTQAGWSADINAQASGNVDVINSALQQDANNEQSAAQASDNSSVFGSDSTTLNGYQGVGK